MTVTFHRAKAGFALDREARRLAGRYLVAPIGIPLEAEDGIVPPDGEWPPARITEVTGRSRSSGRTRHIGLAAGSPRGRAARTERPERRRWAVGSPVGVMANFWLFVPTWVTNGQDRR